MKQADCALATGHLTAHKTKFQPFWAADPAEDKLFRANLEAPTEYADYVLAASHRDYYIDDLLLNAIAERLCTPIIVFAWSPARQIWERSVVSSTFQDGVALIGEKGFQANRVDAKRSSLPILVSHSRDR